LYNLSEINILTSDTTDEKVDRKCKSCEDEEKKKIMRKASSDEKSHLEVSDDVAQGIDNSLHQGESPLDHSTREFMESRFGVDFSNMRIHSDEKAAKSAYVINAFSYTVGKEIVFGAGQYAKGTLYGRHLLAHELAHVIQKRHHIIQRQALTTETETHHITPSHSEGPILREFTSISVLATYSDKELSDFHDKMINSTITIPLKKELARWIGVELARRRALSEGRTFSTPSIERMRSHFT